MKPFLAAGWAQSFKIDKKHYMALTECIGLSKPEDEVRAVKMIGAVARTLWRYPFLQVGEDRSRPASVAIELSNLWWTADESMQAFQKALARLSDAAQCQLYDGGLSIDGPFDSDWLEHLGELIDELHSKESRQAPRKNALRSLIFMLNKVFSGYYAGEQEDFYVDQKSFILIALKAANIKPPSKPTMHQIIAELSQS
jgi:hypothetical protein